MIRMRKFLPGFIIVLVIVFGRQFFGFEEPATQPAVHPEDSGLAVVRASDGSDSVIASAYRDRLSNVQVSGTGIVTRVLADDNDGSRHQRFILELASGQTLLIAHNVDLAPRIGGLREGDRVGFFGEYEWNDQGGVIHWTHADPAGRHIAGWLEHSGQRYQ
jgi:hypothetical protein